MMNLKVRLRNPVFMFQLILSVILPIAAYYGLTGADITSWGTLFKLLSDAAMNPYVVCLVIASVWNALNDPTTKGLGDSKYALKYESPR